MKIFITGIAGFVGAHLAEYLIEKGYCEIHGIIRKESKNKENIKSIKKKVHLYECDLMDITSIESIIAEVNPDLVFHLAAELPHAHVDKTPMAVSQNNIIGTLNLLESLRKNCPEAKILISGSSREYGIVSPEKCPIREDYALMPDNPYAVSKAVQFFIGSHYFHHFGMQIFYARIFYLTGPGQPDGFVCSSVARQAVLMKKKMISKIAVGNLNIKRDFLDIRDAVSALFLITEKGRPGEAYNVCSGRAYSIEEILKIIIRLVQLDNKDFMVDALLVRKNESPIIVGDNSKIFSDTNWRPSIKIENSLEDLLKGYQKTV